MTRSTTTTALAAAATTLALALPAAAGAHVTVQPTDLPAGGYSVVDVRVPNEQDDKGTVKVELQLPPGVSYAAYQPVPNWTAKITTRTPVKPFSVEGQPAEEEISTITWTGKGKEGVIAPGQFLQFPVSLRVPDGAEGSKITFKALQTYEGGEVVRWIGAPDTERPAPTVTLDEAEDEHGDGKHAAAGGTAAPATAAARASDDDSDDDGSDALPIALGAAGLVAGLAGFGIALSGRRRNA
ncbi:YcnI family protein [Patulibacter minatonensis]|uniref:YcnI family copper-binding membrane protein n=1 Tax=Patulibacter minatonensis TaxID=298163 RepID=UPI00047E2156|nr:YcnI family protein [Patulibacter minatonensis]